MPRRTTPRMEHRGRPLGDGEPDPLPPGGTSRTVASGSREVSASRPWNAASARVAVGGARPDGSGLSVALTSVLFRISASHEREDDAREFLAQNGYWA